MTVLPLDPASNASPEALRGFLAQCQAAAAKAGRAQLVSISLGVDALDPLAVLESIFEATEQHFYVERPGEHFAVAGAEAVLSFQCAGADRFANCQRFIDETLAHTIAVGDQQAAFAGPYFFTAFAFHPEIEFGEPFAAAQVFVPRWQVGFRDGQTTAVANLLVGADSPLDLLVEKIWRARKKFAAFDYSEPAFDGRPVPDRPVQVAEVGERGGYETAVARALRMLEAKDVEKIVLARAKDLTASAPFHPLAVLNNLRQRFPDCYAFSIANGKGQSLIGASPERLLRVRGGTLATEALAGSARRGATASEDAALGGTLLRSEKDLAEHDYVLRSIARRLAPLGIDVGGFSRPTLRKFANVQHLHTPLRAPLPAGVRLLDVLAQLHPTPAVGGTPRDRAIARIRELEAFPRGLYAGALGWIDARGEGEFFVGLRSALIDGSQARLYAGAGIVAGSEPARELAETELKFQAIEAALLSRGY